MLSVNNYPNSLYLSFKFFAFTLFEKEFEVRNPLA